MDEQIAKSFLNLINSMIDDKLSRVDHVELCQIVSDDNGSGTYTVKLKSDENTIIPNVVSSRKIPFHTGDYAYLLKIGNQLSNAILIGFNDPVIRRKKLKQLGEAIKEEQEEKVVKYRIYFRLGNYILEGFTSLDPEATVGAPSGGAGYKPGQIVYYFIKKYPDTILYKYICNGTHISGDIYRLGFITMPSGDVQLGTLEGVERYDADKYPINGIISNGYLRGASSIAEGETLTVRLIPNAHYSTPPTLTSISGATLLNYSEASGDIQITKPMGNTNPVIIRARCISYETFDVTFSLGAGITAVYYKINGNEGEAPITVSPTTLSNAIPYKGTLEWYAVPQTGHTTQYTEDNPYLVTNIIRDLEFDVTSDAQGYPVYFSLGPYVVDAFTATNGYATSGNPSGYGYSDDAQVFVFVVKYNDTDSVHYGCNGVYINDVIRNGTTYQLYQINSFHIRGAAVDLGAVSSVTPYTKYSISATITNGSLGSSSDTKIWETGYATLYIVPNTHYGYPSINDFSITGAQLYYYNDQTGQLTLYKPAGNTAAVTVAVTCPVTSTCTVRIIKGTDADGFYYKTGSASNPYTYSAANYVDLTLLYGTSYWFYAAAPYGYYPEYGPDNPYEGTATLTYEEKTANVYKELYRVDFTPGYAAEDSQGHPIVFTSDTYGATGNHNPSGTAYPFGTVVYGFAKAKPEDSTYYYDYSLGEYVTGSDNLYRMITHTVSENVDLGTIGGTPLQKYSITYNIINGTATGSANYILRNTRTITKYMTVDIIPNTSFNAPTQYNVIAYGATITNKEYVTVEGVTRLRITLTKSYDDDAAVSIWARCRGEQSYTLQINKDSNVSTIVCTINEESPIRSTSNISTTVYYGDTYSYYGILTGAAEVGYTATPSESSPYQETVTGTIPTKWAISTPKQFAVTFSLGDYVQSAFTSLESDAVTGNSSGHLYNYGDRVYYFVEKYTNTDEFTYTCSGRYVLGDIFCLGYIVLNESNGALGTLSGVTRTINQYTLNLNIVPNTHVGGIYYNVGSGYVHSLVSVSLRLDYNTAYSWYGETDGYAGYSIVHDSSNPYQGRLTATRSFDIQGNPNYYPVDFTIGNYLKNNNAFTSDLPGQTSGNESGHTYPCDQRVYWYGEKLADTAEYTYDFTAPTGQDPPVQVSGDLYQIGSFILTPYNGSSTIGTIGARRLRNCAIQGTVTHGTVSGATYIAEAKTAIIYIKPDNHYVAPNQLSTLSGATASYDQVVIDGVTCLQVTLSKSLGDTSTVQFTAYCPSSEYFNFKINKGEGVYEIHYTLNGVSNVSLDSVNVQVGYETDFVWYTTPSAGYTSQQPSSSPVQGTVYTDYEANATATKNWYNVSFTTGDYMTRGFTSLSSTGATENPSPTSYEFGSTIYYFIEKYANTAQYTYTCSGTHIRDNIYQMGSIVLGPADTNIDITQGVTRTTNQYDITITRPSNTEIPYVWYKGGSITDYTQMTGDSVTLTWDYGTEFSWYAQGDLHHDPVYNGVIRDEYSPYEGTVTGDATFAIIAALKSYPVYFSLGSNVTAAFTSALEGQTSGNESGHVYPYNTRVYLYGTKVPDTATTMYEFTGAPGQPAPIQISGNLYQIESAVVYEATDFYEVSATARHIYPITNTIYNGTVVGDTSIVETKTATVTIVPDSGYSLPTSVSVTNASYSYDSSTGVITLSNPTGYSGTPVYVTITARCRGSSSYTLTFTKDTGVSTVVYYINGQEGRGADFPVTVTVYNGDDYSFYGILTREYEDSGGYDITPSETNPGTGSIINSNVTEHISVSAKSFTVGLTLGNYMTSGFTSTSDSATTGNTQPTAYDYNTTVYYYIVKENNTDQYTYTVFGSSQEIEQISGNIYKMGHIVVGAANTTIDVTQGGTQGVSRSLTSYAVKLRKGAHITGYYYSVGDPGTYTYTTDLNTDLSVPYGTTYYWYAIAETGWYCEYDSRNNPYSYTVTGLVSPNLITALPNSYTVSFTVNNAADAAFTSTTDGATSGNASGHSYLQEDVVYYYAQKKADDTDYTYDYSAGTLVPGTANIYKMGSVTINGANVNLGAIGGTRLNNYSITGNITNGSLSGATYIVETRTATVYLSANTHYGLPADADISAVGATIDSITESMGQKIIVLKNARADVTVTAVCPVVDQYTLTFTPPSDAHITEINYKIGSGSWTSWDPSGSQTGSLSVSVYYGYSYEWYVTPSYGYYTTYDSSNHYTGVMVGNVTFTSDLQTYNNQYYVDFTLGFAQSAFTSTNQSATSGNPTHTVYDYGTRVYYFAEALADTAEYTYDYSAGVLVSGDIYRMGSLVVSENIDIGTIGGRQLRNYSITTTAAHGTASGDTYIVQTRTAEVIITPDTYYNPPLLADISVSGASFTYTTFSSGGVMRGKITLSSPTGNVTITAPCKTTTTFSFAITKGSHIDKIYYALNESPSYTETSSDVSLVLLYGTTYSWYATTSSPVWVPEYGPNNPDTGTVTGPVALEAVAFHTLVAPTIRTMYDMAQTSVKVFVTNPSLNATVSATYTYEYETSYGTVAGSGSIASIASGATADFLITQSGREDTIIGGTVTVRITATGYIAASATADFADSQPYTITYNITHGEEAPGSPDTVAFDGCEPITILADDFYTVPDSITVAGATFTWEPYNSQGDLFISAATQDITVLASCVRKQLLAPYIEITYNASQTVATISVLNQDNPPVSCYYTYNYRASTTHSGTNILYGTIATDGWGTFNLGSTGQGEIIEGTLTIRFVDSAGYEASNTVNFEDFKTN